MPEKLSTPYTNLLPPLTTEERDALAASLKADGQRDPITVDEHGNILDGHHRAALLKHPKTRVIRGLTDAEKQAYVFQANLVRRNLSPEQKREALKAMKQVAFALRAENPKQNTQAVVAAMLGVTQQAVAKWFVPNTTGSKGNNAKLTPDALVRVPHSARPTIMERVDSGEPQEQVAADFGVTQGQNSDTVKPTRRKPLANV